MASRLDSISPSSSLEMSRNSRLNLAVSQREWLLQICLRRGCDYTASEFGLCSSHSNECHFPTCDDNYPNSIDGFCDDHAGQCQKPMCKNEADDFGVCSGHLPTCFYFGCFEEPTEETVFCPLHIGVCAKPFCDDLAPGGAFCFAHSQYCIKPYCSNFHDGNSKCWEHQDICGFMFCADYVDEKMPEVDFFSNDFSDMFAEPTKLFFCFSHQR